MGYYYEEINSDIKANQAYLKAFNLEPNNTNANLYYASFLCHLNDFNEANQKFNYLLNLKDNIILGESNQAYALCLLKQENIEKAKTYFENALQYNPKLPFSYFNLADISFNEGNYENADNLMRYYKNHFKENKKSLTLQMQIAEKLGEDNKAASIRLRLASI